MRFFISVFLVITDLLWCKAETFTVCPNCAIKDLQMTKTTAGRGDTILIKPGVYPSINTFIDKPLTIIGENYPVIDAQLKEEVITVTSDKVTLTGLDIRNTKTGDMRDYAGIRIFKAHDVQILNCHLDNTLFGIYVGDSKHVL